MSLAIHKLERRENLTNEAVDAFLAGREFPLVEGPAVTFVYRGEAEKVLLQHWVYGLSSSRELKRIPNSNLWFLVMELPPKSRVEYKFKVVQGKRSHWVRDPRNPYYARDPFGANSVCHSQGYITPDWVVEDPEARPGVVEEFSLRDTALGSTQNVRVYLPARFRRTRRYPLLVVHDGFDYQNYASLKVVLDNLIHRLEIPPMIVALTQSSDRLKEYAAHEPHGRFIVQELLPLLESRLPLIQSPEKRCLMGASFGAVAALSTAWFHPGVFNKLLLQSGSFAFTDIGHEHHRGTAFDPVVEFVNRFRDNPGKPAACIYVSCGTYESLIYENRSLVPFLQAQGMKVRFSEARDGHNWENWRDRLREALAWLFPGPLWMVYE